MTVSVSHVPQTRRPVHVSCHRALNEMAFRVQLSIMNRSLVN